MKVVKQFEEIIDTLKTAQTAEEIDEIRDSIEMYIPQIRIMFGYDQKNAAHQYDLWMHCVHTVMGLERNMDDNMLYLAALLHDIGKPECQVAGKREGDTNMHYYGHPEKSAEIVEKQVIVSLRENGVNLSEEDQSRLVYYVRYHDDQMSLKMKSVRKHSQITNLNQFKKLMLLQIADAEAHVRISIIEERIRICRILSGQYADELWESIQE